LKYRSLTSTDYSLWRGIRLEALSNHPDCFLTTQEEELARPKSATNEWLDSGAVLGAFDNNDLCSILSVDPEKHPAMAHRGWIHAVYTRPAWRKGPASHGLMEFAAANALDNGLLQLELHVADGNLRAIRFYERMGFELCGRIPRSVRFADGFQNDLHYCRPLNGSAASQD
jgi:GNAT superfamily N-acetyltransferase